MKNLIKKLLFILLLSPTYITFAMGSDLEVDWFNILPELTEWEITGVNEKITEIWQEWWKVWEKYNKVASGMTTSEQVASWIMNWDTIMNYLVFVVQFLSQLWITVGVVFIMYAWYKYMLSVFDGKGLPTSTVKNAIIWVALVIFSYAIFKILTSLIGIS